MPVVSARRRLMFGVILSGVAVSLGGGCAADRPREVPKSALYKVGGNERLIYVAETDGTLYISDDSAKDLLFSTDVRRGDRVELDPERDQLLLNERPVYTKDIPRRTHKIYLLPGVGGPLPPVETARGRVIARPAAVPVTAGIAGEGKRRIEYTAPDHGQVWIVDGDGDDRDTILYSGRVNRGDRILVDPDKDEVLVAGMKVSERNLGERTRRIFFAPGPAARADVPRGQPDSVRFDELRDNQPIPVPAARPAEVPATAVVRGDRAGPQEFVADADGTVWVVNAANNQIVYSGRIFNGDSLRVDPAASEISLNGRRADSQGFSGDRYRIYFKRGE